MKDGTRFGLRWHLVPTLKCQPDEPEDSAGSLTAVQWNEVIRFLGRGVVLTYGEPLLYPEIHELVKLLDGWGFWVHSNPAYVTNELLTAMDDNSRVHLGIRLDHGDTRSLTKNESLTQWIRGGFPEIRLRPVLQPPRGADALAFTAKQPCRVLCHRTRKLVGPDGYRYPCMHHLRRRTNRMEYVNHEAIESASYTTVCDDYGKCEWEDQFGPVRIETCVGGEKPGVVPFRGDDDGQSQKTITSTLTWPSRWAARESTTAQRAGGR